MNEVYRIFPFECKHGKPQRELKAKLKPKYTHTHTLMSRDTTAHALQCTFYEDMRR